LAAAIYFWVPLASLIYGHPLIGRINCPPGAL